MPDKKNYIDAWKRDNTPYPGESADEFEARAVVAWTTHNEDPGEGLLSAGDDQGLYFAKGLGSTVPDLAATRAEPDTSFDEDNPNGLSDEELGLVVSREPPAGDKGPAPEVLIEDPDRTLNVVVTDGAPGDLGQERPGEMFPVEGAPDYRVGRPVYSAVWFFYRPGETTPQGSYPNKETASQAARIDDDAETQEEREAALARPIGRTVDPAVTRSEGMEPETGFMVAARHLKGLLATRGGPLRASAPVVPISRSVVLESPYAGDVERNTEYARRAMADCLARGEAPFASHLLYTQVGVLDDSNAEERKRGIEAGFMIADGIGKAVFYLDYGMSPGMAAALTRFAAERKVIEFRFLGVKEAEL